jgi:hypothetical protein
MIGRIWTVEKRKSDGRLRYRWPGELLLDPRTAGAYVLHHDGARFAKGEVRDPNPVPAHALRIVVPGSSLLWMISADEQGRITEVKGDAALPAQIDEAAGLIAFVDLDVDFIADAEGVRIRDREQYRRRRKRFGYDERTDAIVEAAMAAAAAAHADRRLPFDGRPEALIAALRAR